MPKTSMSWEVDSIKVTELFTVNGQPMLMPDEGVGFSFEDIDRYDAGRDEAGVMHRKAVRYKVGVWSFSYSVLTEEEKQYLENLFPDSGTFTFGHPDRKNALEMTSCEAYRSRYSLTWQNARTGLWKNCAFQIIEC